MEVSFNMNEEEFIDLFNKCLQEEGLKKLREFYVEDDESNNEKRKKNL